jgi:hypothetical protein
MSLPKKESAQRRTACPAGAAAEASAGIDFCEGMPPRRNGAAE